uniref:Spermidine putrescine ABC transporter permease component potC n=1 Tax=uncultured bacterium contig00013 TaxID=1181504 RepID=A0A806KQV2_9BACT|nr:spermidine putrescine ABC transporter permease component potC [uncultured bacterium contig00013]
MSKRNMFHNLITIMKNRSRSAGEASRHAKRAARRRFSFSQTLFVITMVFLFTPLFILVISSFNDTTSMRWTGFSLRWYQRLFSERELWRSFWNSIIIAVSSGLTATVIGTLGAIGVNWYRFRLRSYVQTISFLPMILPEIIIGVSLVIFFASVGIPLGLFTIYVAHTTFNLPFVFLLVMARLNEFDFSIIEAAQDLGATERETLMKVTVPVCMPGIISGFLTAVTLSLEDFVITFFVAGPGSSTLPIFIYSAITRRGSVTPVISALSVVMIIGTVILTYMLRNFLKHIAPK